jgi:adenine-specific DNA-methyltransferase
MSPSKKIISSIVSTPTRSSRFTDLDADKLRGGYYTSEEITTWLCSWAIQSTEDRVLEPSCGNGAFLRAAAHRYKELGARKSIIPHRLKGVELNAVEADLARTSLCEIVGAGGDSIVETSDFFSWLSEQSNFSFDAIIGNPPFIRYQSFPEPHRSRAMALMVEQGLKPNKLTNIWVPFVVAAVSALREGGRLALVLPAEILQVTYAAQLRSFLTDRFNRIDIISCNELFFEKAEQEVILLLADGANKVLSEKHKCKVALTAAATVNEIVNRTVSQTLVSAELKTVKHDSEKWLKYFLTQREISFMRDLRDSKVTTSLSTHASIDVGVVTGKNEFFVLTSEQVKELGLEGFTAPLISRSMHLKGARVGKDDWTTMAESGGRVHLLDLKPIRGKKLSASLRRYIEQGEALDFHTGYKCSIRDPWYEVPSVWIPDGFLFRQIYDFPRIVLNEAEATSTDTIHRLSAKTEEPERIIANTYTWMTAASAEIEGRSYGGGVLELEPTEAERLLLPAILNGALPLSECDRLTREGRLDTVLEENARVVLIGHMGLSKSDTNLLKNIWEKMRNRRMSRGKSAKKK